MKSVDKLITEAYTSILEAEAEEEYMGKVAASGVEQTPEQRAEMLKTAKSITVKPEDPRYPKDRPIKYQVYKLDNGRYTINSIKVPDDKGGDKFVSRFVITLEGHEPVEKFSAEKAKEAAAKINDIFAQYLKS